MAWCAINVMGNFWVVSMIRNCWNININLLYSKIDMAKRPKTMTADDVIRELDGAEK